MNGISDHSQDNIVTPEKPRVEVSDKSYGVAVALSAVFGVLGIHHFYAGRYWYGLFDLGLSVLVFYHFIIGSFGWAFIFFAIDVVHTFIETIRLLIGSYTDGDGKVIAYPGQFKEPR